MKNMKGRTKKLTLGLLCGLVFVGYIVTVWANPPSGVTPTLIGRGTFDDFKLHADNLDFKVEAKSQIDLVVRTNDYLPGASSGWHTHPGPQCAVHQACTAVLLAGESDDRYHL